MWESRAFQKTRNIQIFFLLFVFQPDAIYYSLIFCTNRTKY